MESDLVLLALRPDLVMMGQLDQCAGILAFAMAHGVAVDEEVLGRLIILFFPEIYQNDNYFEKIFLQILLCRIGVKIPRSDWPIAVPDFPWWS